MHKIDYIKTFAPIIRRNSLKIFLVIAILLKMIILQIDVINAYSKSALGQGNYSIYMKIPQNWKVDRDDLVYKILKSPYKLKQVERL